MSSAFACSLERPLALMVSAGPLPDQENELEAPTMLKVSGPFLAHSHQIVVTPDFGRRRSPTQS